VKTTQQDAKGHYTVGKRGGRWWVLTPEREPMFSIGLNHIDSATLRYEEGIAIWREKYGNSQKRWLTESVAPNLRQWRFNTVGWVQEVVTRDDKNHRHSRNFTFEEYQWLGMPYCHLLPFSEVHQWEVETRLPDVRGKGFEEWCDYVARDQCARFRDDAELIGYFYSDCPTWVHVRKDNAWRGPLFDPDRLSTPAGRKELGELATRYYKVTHDAIRRYDPHHLILGDRYEAQAPLPEEVVRAAMPYVDVLSFQCFGGPKAVREKLTPWAALTKRPILLADSSVCLEPHVRPLPPGADRHQDGAGYRKTMEVLQAIPECIGFHLCGAYMANRVRRCGLLDRQDRPDAKPLQAITEVNRRIVEWTETFGKL